MPKRLTVAKEVLCLVNYQMEELFSSQFPEYERTMYTYHDDVMSGLIVLKGSKQETLYHISIAPPSTIVICCKRRSFPVQRRMHIDTALLDCPLLYQETALQVLREIKKTLDRAINITIIPVPSSSATYPSDVPQEASDAATFLP